MNINDYIEAVKTTTDVQTLQKKLHVYDNWLVLFYGNRADIFNNLVEDFRNSPRKDLMSKAFILERR